jgi:hypothetical protein
MPGSERSLEITDAYRARLAALTHRVGTFAAVTWQQAVNLDDLDGSHASWLATVTVALEQAQRSGVNLTLAYLAAFIASETGRRAVEIPAYNAAGVIGVSDTGQPLAVPLSKTVIDVKVALKDGKSPADALAGGEQRALRLAETAAMHAPRAALQDQIGTHPMLVGWRRVTAGGCGACMAAAAHGYSKGEPMHVHAHCRCSQEPVVKDVPDRAPRETGPDIFARMTRAEQDQALGPAAAEAVRAGAVAWPDLIGHSPMVMGPPMLTQAPLAAV